MVGGQDHVSLKRDGVVELGTAEQPDPLQPTTH